MVSFASSMMKSIAVFPARLRFAVKLTCCIAFGSVLSACCLLKSIYLFIYLFIYSLFSVDIQLIKAVIIKIAL